APTTSPSAPLSAGSSARRSPRRCRSSRCSAMPWARPARSVRPPVPSRSSRGSPRRPSTTGRPTRTARSTACPTRAGRPTCRSWSTTGSPSVGTTRSSSWAGPASRRSRPMRRDTYPVIAGTAALCAVGAGVDECFERLVAGDSGVGPLVAFPAARFGVRNAYQVSEPPRAEREHLLASRLLVEAVKDAAADAGLASLRGVPVVVGTGLGETRTVESAWLDGKPLDDAESSLVEGVRLATDAEDVQVFSNACSASLYALAVGCDLIIE